MYARDKRSSVICTVSRLCETLRIQKDLQKIRGQLRHCRNLGGMDFKPGSGEKKETRHQSEAGASAGRNTGSRDGKKPFYRPSKTKNKQTNKKPLYTILNESIKSD